MEYLTDKIQDYIEGNLQGEELQEFETQLANDTEFRNVVALQKEVHAILNKRLNSDEGNLRQTLTEQSNIFRNQPNVKVRNLKPWYAIAAVACVLIFGTLFFFNPSNDLYDLPTMQSEIVRGQESNVTYEEAVWLFNQKSYAEAQVALEALAVEDPSVIQFQYYAALTYIGEKNWNAAVSKLETIASGKSIFADEAKYYLAISYDKLGKDAEAIDVLQRISSSGSLGQKAKKLLDKLN